jgi:hypothetical protein
LTPGDPVQLRQTIQLFGGAFVGLALPQSAQGQSQWTITSGEGSNPGSWGGHCVVAGKFFHAKPETHYTVITWGAPLMMSQAFNSKYSDEVYAVFSQDWIDQDKLSPSGFDTEQLLADLAEL